VSIRIPIGSRVFAPSWFFTILTVILCVAFYFLGRWQWNRGELRQAEYDRFASGAEQVIALGSKGVDQVARFQRVSAVGHLDADHQFLLDNRSYQGRAGFEVLTPLQRPNGRVVLVDRGWVQLSGLRDRLPGVALETNDGLAKNNNLLDVNGKVIATAGARFYAGIRMEGTGRTLDGKVINFHARVGGDIRWRVCPPDAPYGYGLQDFKLKPFHSVAVDPKVVPIPSRVYIPAAKGAVLPDGSVHDGYFEAVDIGDAIQDQRIDVFTSMGDQSAVFEKHGLTNMAATAVYLVDE